MSEEEIKAIEYIKAFQKDLYGASEKNLMAIYIDRVWNYIDRLQKELKDSINARFELQRRIDKTQKENAELKRITYKAYINDNGEIQFIFDNYISKDKIKEALGDENIPDEMILTYIDTLVSENARLEDIEDRKVQIEYNNVFNKGVKSVEDKVRTEIKELEDKKKEFKNTTITMNGEEFTDYIIKILKELLGDE